MQQLPGPTTEIVGKGGFQDKLPKVILLDRKQWLYVQNRYHLTPRERQIAELICQGLRNGNIAKSLHIRPGTVKTHIRNIYRKVRVENKISMLLTFLTKASELSDQYDRGIPVRIAESE